MLICAPELKESTVSAYWTFFLLLLLKITSMPVGSAAWPGLRNGAIGFYIFFLRFVAQLFIFIINSFQ